MVSLLYCQIHFLCLPIFYLVCGLIHLKIFLEALVIVIPFLFFKGTTRAYLLEIHSVFFYKNTLYKNIEAQIVPKNKNKLRTS